MSEPRHDTAVLAFFANALMAIGWMILGLGGLCTLAFGAMTLLTSGEIHTRLGDWMLPGSMLVIGGGLLWLGRAIRRALTNSPAKSTDD
jgi:hypothetical protein